MNEYIPIADVEFSRFLVIKLDPVYALDLAVAATNGYYSIESYIDGYPETKINIDPKTGTDRDTFPPISPSFPNLFYIPTPQKTSGLCNLYEIFPNIPTKESVYTFNLNLTGATEALEEANLSGTNKFINEVSIYFNKRKYQKNTDIICSFNDYLVPCNWNTSGFINIRFYESLVPESTMNIIKIRGIKTPFIAPMHND